MAGSTVGQYGNSGGGGIGSGGSYYPGDSGVSLASTSSTSLLGAGGFGGLLNSIGTTFANVWGAINQPSQVTLPGGGILQNGQAYYPQGTVLGGNSSFMLLLVGALVLFVVMKK